MHQLDFDRQEKHSFTEDTQNNVDSIYEEELLMFKKFETKV
jgi:hypothetical protein